MEVNDEYLKKIIDEVKNRLPDNELPLDKIMPRLKAVQADTVPRSILSKYDGKVYHLDREQQLVCEPFVDDIWLFYAIDRQSHFEFVQERHLTSDGVIELPDLRDIAVTNMIPEIEKQFAVHDTEEGFYAATCGGNYEAALLLLPGLWQQIEAQIGENLLVSVPNRDVCLFVHDTDTDAINNLKIVVHKAHTSGSYPLSRNIFKRNGEEWKVVDCV
ncbi:MAG: hypothetical protein RI894_1378 [Bacteroidota bacterium]|jgi:uncharacterized protein YtpQ (UPF0354 family)